MKFLVIWGCAGCIGWVPCCCREPVLVGEMAPLLSNEIPFVAAADWAACGKGWLTAVLRPEIGVLDLEIGALPSPSLTSDSIVLSRLPPKPFKTVVFRFSSAKPISLNCTNFASSSPPPPPTLVPKTRDCLLILIGEGGPL